MKVEIPVWIHVGYPDNPVMSLDEPAIGTVIADTSTDTTQNVISSIADLLRAAADALQDAAADELQRGTQ